MAKKKLNFEESIERLEQIVERLETEEISLDEAVAYYKEGLTLSAFCKEKLTVAEGEILLLRKEAGLWQEEPFQTEEQEL
ncbi:exodeoxyribonuclease 7 small subunit [Anaerotignum neopropionicum]|uniref:Exodeoxyribonuclease 7 small subunit n=1 Tax=Anaerotignum neopropionicum TaxID=36847 RepID=A0A136WF46_9FIRM|nr:exodeoxyribonuclease VII small subunit [Anaerotignum neopropionicum]KXL53053.1 exodeoxyribonuclease 7 small subunit [Anaerotignum neopropionicum]